MKFVVCTAHVTFWLLCSVLSMKSFITAFFVSSFLAWLVGNMSHVELKLSVSTMADEFCALLRITQHHVVIVYRRFGTTYRSLLHGSRVPFLVRFSTGEDGTDTLSRNVS
jgi:hypothetical protein